MRLPFHRSLRRLTSLYVAKRALAVGAPERALASLQDPVHGGSASAEALRQQALSELCRLAARRARDGRDRSAGRLIGVVAAEDFERARACRDRIGWMLEVGTGEAPLIRASSLERLERVEERDAREGSDPKPDRHKRLRRDPMAAADYMRMAIDDGGDWLVVALDRVRIGHERGLRAELPFLADVGVEHAVLESVQTLRGGHAWTLTPCGNEPVRVAGQALTEGLVLQDGQRIDLGANLSMVFASPGSDSASAVLRLARGAECLGATAIALLLGGEDGVLRVGPTRAAHVQVSAMAEELLILRRPEGFELRRIDPVTGEPRAAARLIARPLTLEPGARVELRVPRRGEGAPVGITLSALDVVPGWEPAVADREPSAVEPPLAAEAEPSDAPAGPPEGGGPGAEGGDLGGGDAHESAEREG